MTVSVTHSTPADGSFSATGATAWNATHTLTGTLAVANGGTGLSSTPENGQLLIGNGTGFSYATLTAGANVSITNGSGSIQISATGGGGGGSGAGNAYGWFIS